MHITALQPQATNPDRTNIFVDGRFLLGASTLIILEMGLHVNQELTPAQLQRLEQEEAMQKALDRAMNFLASRPHSRVEIQRYLRRKEVPQEIIPSVLERLESLGLIDDQQFAEFWIESRGRLNPKGVQAIRGELRAKGITNEVLDEVVSDENDEELALQAGRKKAQSLARQSGIDFNTFRSKLGPFLQRRGFGYEVAKHATQTLWQEMGLGDADE